MYVRWAMDAVAEIAESSAFLTILILCPTVCFALLDWLYLYGSYEFFDGVIWQCGLEFLKNLSYFALVNREIWIWF